MSSKLSSVEQKNIYELFGAKDSLFLIPDYQRPYAWEEDECLTLWNDMFTFARTDGDFDLDDEYFLGPIVVFRNAHKQFEVIDGQQRLISLLLILRAFYEEMQPFSGDWSCEVRKNIGRCIWKTNEQGQPSFFDLKMDSQVATDNDKLELLSILEFGTANNNAQSRYAKNYRLFQEKVSDFLGNQDRTDKAIQNQYAALPHRILTNCMLLPIEANGQNAALRIFSTLNDRGKPLSDSDIFKVQLYKAFAEEGRKDTFIAQWKELEEVCGRIFSSEKISNPVDELFNRYMHYERASLGLKDTTQEGLRSFYEKDNYRLLRVEHKRVFANLLALADFWNKIANQDEDCFSERVLKRLFVLNYAPNSAWTLITSVYFMSNRRVDETLDEEKFHSFLGKITAFIWATTIVDPGVGYLRTPLYKEMLRIVHGQEVTFEAYKFNAENLLATMQKYKFSGKKRMTRSMLAWWAMNHKEQSVPLLTTIFETEHLSKKGKTVNPDTYEMLGNKSLLERKIKGATSSSLDFADKKNTTPALLRYAGQARRFVNSWSLQGLRATSTLRIFHSAARKS